jgi:hypothetical protein
MDDFIGIRKEPASLCPSSLECQEHTTSPLQRPLELVTITHPFHPLRGQQVEVIRVRRGTDPDIIVRHPDGSHAAVAMSWTNYAVPAGTEPPSTPPHLLDFTGLCQAVQLIDRIRQDDRYPTADDGDGFGTPISDGYD